MNSSSEWRSPWTSDRRRPNAPITRYPLWLRLLKDRVGVYAVRDKDTKQVLYVGRGRKDLKKSLVRHFAAWNAKDWWTRSHHYWTVDRTTVEVKVWVAEKAEDVVLAEARVIARLKPCDNRRLEKAALEREPGEDDVMEEWIDPDGRLDEGVPF